MCVHVCIYANVVSMHVWERCENACAAAACAYMLSVNCNYHMHTEPAHIATFYTVNTNALLHHALGAWYGT